MQLVIGATGMLGRAYLQTLERQRGSYHAPSREEFELTNSAGWSSIDWASFDSVVNCAAYTDVDGAESAEADAMAVNGDAVAELAAVCAQAGTTLVHFSTDYVFAGDADVPYAVDAPLAPIGAYGRTKAAGERAIRDAAGPHLILRTSWLYAAWGSNFVRTIARLCRERDTLSVVNDQRGRPTSAHHLADATFALLDAEARGTLHVTDGGACTWFDFATEIALLTGSGCTVEPCSSDAFPRPAPRPAYSVLDLALTEALLGPMPSWRSNLDAVVAQL